MADWDIIRIKDDSPAPTSERWTIVYSVPTHYSPDGVFSLSMPKNVLNSVAVAFEYDFENDDDVNDMFDHLITRPMFTFPLPADPPPGDFTALMHFDNGHEAQFLNGARRAVDGTDMYTRDPAELRENVKVGIDLLKGGLGRIKPAGQVELHEAGRMVGLADMSENPKYLVMRDMVSRLRPDNIVEGLRIFRDRRRTRMARAKG